VWELADETIDDGDRRIIKALHPEDHLEAWIVLFAEAAKVLVQVAVVAPQGLQHADGGRGTRGRGPTAAEEIDAYERAEPVQCREDARAEQDEV
jgi:hypothetical protein